MSKMYGPTQLRGTGDGTNVPTINYKARGEASAATRQVKIMKVSFKDAENYDVGTDGNGVPDGIVEKTVIDECTVTVRVKATSIANARLEARVPIRQTPVTLANVIAAAHTFLNGEWAYHGGGTADVIEGNEDEFEMVLPIKRYYAGDNATLVPLTGDGGMLVPVS